MSALLGITLGLGLLLVWQSTWVSTRSRPRVSHEPRIQQLISAAGLTKIHPSSVIAVSILAGLVSFVLVAAVTRAVPIGVCFAVFAAYTPWAILQWQSTTRAQQLRDIWPDAIDHLRSAIRAGMTLPEALSQLGARGPVELAEGFQRFSANYRAGMRFQDALTELQRDLADPVADRLVAALNITREVGGSDIGIMLETLSEFLREDARTRAELETRQSWTVNGARLAVIAPWVVLILLAMRPEAAAAYHSWAGLWLLLAGIGVCVICYRLMIRIGKLPAERRVL